MLKVQVSRISYNVVKNFNHYSFKILVEIILFFLYLINKNSLGIEDNAVLAAEWETSIINELDLSSTELTEQCLLNLFLRMPKLNYLAVPNCDGFTDQVKMIFP